MKIFLLKIFDIFIIFALNIDCGYTLEPPRRTLTSTHNLCFGANIRKIGIPLHGRSSLTSEKDYHYLLINIVSCLLVSSLMAD